MGMQVYSYRHGGRHYLSHAGNVNGPVVQSLTAGGAALPNARRISAIVHTFENKPDPRAAIMLMQWGQFLDHDLTGTPGGE